MAQEEVKGRVLDKMAGILMKQYGVPMSDLKRVLEIPEILIKDLDQSVRRPNWQEGDLLRGWEIAVKYLKEEYGFVKCYPKEEKSNE